MTEHFDSSGNQTGLCHAFDASAPEVDEETAKGSHLHNYRPRTHEKVAMGYKASRHPFLPIWGDSECSSCDEMPAGGIWEGEES